jgi:SAM-dependent methyltransferase
VIGVRGFLKREGFDFDKKSAQIDCAFLKLFSTEKGNEIRGIWQQIQIMGASPTKLYAVPRTLEQAHLLMSYDRERYLAGFNWIAQRVEILKPKSILEVGSGTGVLLRYLAANFPDVRYQGIDMEANLIGAAPADDRISLLVGDYLTMEAKSEFDLVICNFGFDSDRFPASTTPHSIAQVGESQFCPGCSDDLARHLQPYFRAWRGWAKENAALLVTGRIGSFGFLRAVVLAAAGAGWNLELDNSAVLKVADPDVGPQRYPALQFRVAVQPATILEQVERFFVTST